MITLAIDTSSTQSAACLFDSETEQLIAMDSRDIGRGHAEIIIDQIDACLRQAQLDYQSLGRIAVARGPGSFTGVRVGLAATKGLVLSLDIPAIGVSCLDASRLVAADLSEEADPIVLLDAKRGQVYASFSPDSEPVLLSVESAAEKVSQMIRSVCGSGAPLIAEHLESDLDIIHTNSVSPIEVYARLGISDPDPDTRLEPLYLRSADAKPQAGFALPRRAG